MNVSIPSGKLCITRATNERIPSLYRLPPLPFSFSIQRFNTKMRMEPIAKKSTNRNNALKPVPKYGKLEGIKSKILTIIMTERDMLMANVINSFFLLTGMNIPKHPSIVEKPAILASIKGQTISISFAPHSPKIYEINYLIIPHFTSHFFSNKVQNNSGRLIMSRAKNNARSHASSNAKNSANARNNARSNANAKNSNNARSKNSNSARANENGAR